MLLIFEKEHNKLFYKPSIIWKPWN